MTALEIFLIGFIVAILVVSFIAFRGAVLTCEDLETQAERQEGFLQYCLDQMGQFGEREAEYKKVLGEDKIREVVQRVAEERS